MSTRNRPVNKNNMLYMAVLLVLMLVSCEKEVHINLASVPPSVVVQGSIETGEVPYVILTSSIGFFSKVDLATLEKSFIHDADVKVSDGVKTITLKEYSFDTGGSFKFYIYTIDTANLANAIVGENGKTYSLSIGYEGKTYNALTKIPIPQGIDTMWFDRPQFANDNTLDSARQLYVNYVDPDTPGDYVRYYTMRDNEQFIPSSDNFTDELINGKRVNRIGLAAGYVNTGEERNRDSVVYFFPGETVTLKWCAVDKGVYTFWNTLNFARSAVGNPFSTAINPTSNMSNGALGVWAGYGAFYKTAVVTY